MPRSGEDLDRLASLIKGAIGYDQERNDIFEIENVQFHQEEYEFSDGILSGFNFNKVLEILFKVFLVIVGLIILMKFKKYAGGVMERNRAEAKRRAAAEEAERKRQELMPKFKNEPKLVDHIRKIATEDPVEMSKVIKTMLSQE